MIGNDIVDLHLAEKESNIQRKGFLDKLFLPDEKRMIGNAAHPAVMLWLLWSCKEAVYKIIHRATRERRYAPHLYNCRLWEYNDVTATGAVIYQQQSYYFQSTRIGSCIHTYAALNPKLLQQAIVFTRYHLVTDYACLLSANDILSSGQLFYKDEDGLPYIRYRDAGANMPVSVSHHGKYLGIVRLPE